MKRTNFNSRGGIKSARFLFIALVTIIAELGLSFNASSILDQATFGSSNIVDLSNIEPVEKVETGTLKSNYAAKQVVATYTPAARPATQPAVQPVSSYDHISILGRNLKVVTSNTTAWTPEYDVARFISGSYNGVFYYAHNSSNIFGGLANLRAGSTFSITLGGVTRNYRVAVVETVPNDDALAKDMSNVARAIHKGTKYSVSLMTCAGTALPGRNATHRTLVFAYEF